MISQKSAYLKKQNKKYIKGVRHYLDLSTQPNEPEKLLTSNIHLLSPQKWSQFVHLNRENIFPRGQP